MKGSGAKRNVCPGSCVSTGAKFPVAPVESAPMFLRSKGAFEDLQGQNFITASVNNQKTLTVSVLPDFESSPPCSALSALGVILIISSGGSHQFLYSESKNNKLILEFATFCSDKENCHQHYNVDDY